MKQGRIIKVISNHYTIQTEDGRQVVAQPRGKMRLKQAPLVGDIATFEEFDDAARIDSIAPRKNKLLRPAVVNVDQALIVTSLKDPDYSAHLLNRLIFLVCLSDIQPVIVVTKADLMSQGELDAFRKEIQWYENAGYKVFFSSPGSNDDELCEILKGKISVLCGQSGAGKSSLLNRLDPSFHLRTQQISKSLGRGKHTTRHCELHPVAGGLVADTPGFSSLDFTTLDVSRLDSLIPDFQNALEQGCRFADCHHVNEPDCAIKEAVEAGTINPTIYEDYRHIMDEFLRRKKY